MVLGLLFGPELLHRLDALAQHGKAFAERRTVVLDLRRIPPGADTELEAPVGKHVETGDLLGELDGVALHDQADAGAEQNLFGRLCGGRQADEGIHRLVVHGRQAGHSGPRRHVRHGNVRVFRHPKGIESAILRCGG